MYAAQGLPFGLFIISIPAWMAAQAYEPAQIGSFIGIAALPWSLKLVVAPVMDRFGFPAMGERRPWVILAQVGCVLCYAAFFWLPPGLALLATLGFVTNSFSAAQDVAVDGMAIKLLPAEERARANGFMFGGQQLGIALGGSGGGYLLNSAGYTGVAVLGVVTTFLILLLPLLLRERPEHKLFPWSPGISTSTAQEHSALQMGMDLLRRILAPVSLLILASQFLYRSADGLLNALHPVFLVQSLDWADTAYSDWYTTGSIVGAVVGVLVSPWIDRLQPGRAFWWIIAAKLAIFAAAIPLLTEQSPLIGGYLVAQGIASHLLAICVIARLMHECAGAAIGTQFAVYMALANLSYSAGAFLYAQLSAYSVTTLLLLGIGMLLAAMVCWRLAAGINRSATPAPDSSDR